MSKIGAIGDDAKLKEFLAAHAVERVLFIDDGFEPLEQVEPTQEEQEELWTAIEADPAAFPVASREGLTQPSDLNGGRIAELLVRPEADVLRQLAEQASYVVEHASKTKQILFAIDYLRSLGVTVLTCGREGWLDQLEGVSIVFLDWRLGPEPNHIKAIEEASKVAAQISEETRPNRPMIVLISSDPAVKEAARSFSRHSGLLLGLFDAIPKEWLQDRSGVDLQLTVLAEHLQKGHVVQAFFDAVHSRTTEAIISFIDKIRGLTLSDYANLQNLALKRDGHPLGDYLAELLAGVWVDALFQGQLREQLRALNKENFESLPALTSPSEGLTNLYMASGFDTHVGDFEPHPQAQTLLQGEARGERLSIALGDVIVETEGEKPSKAYVIINPQCDLAESPRHQRRIDDDLSVLLVPGVLQPVGTRDRAERKDTADTPFFATDGMKNRIRWEGKKQIAVAYADLPKWLATKSRRRKARMRPMFALALQNAIRSDLSRVGLPAPPPMYQIMDVQIRRAKLGTWVGEPVGVSQGRLLMARDAKEDRIVFTHAFLTSICQAVASGVEALAASTKPKDKENATKIADALADPAELSRLVKPFAVSDGGVSFLGGAVIVCRTIPKGLDRKVIICLSVPESEVLS